MANINSSRTVKWQFRIQGFLPWNSVAKSFDFTECFSITYLHNVTQETYTPVPNSRVGFVAYKHMAAEWHSGVSSNILRTAAKTIVNNGDLVAVCF